MQAGASAEATRYLISSCLPDKTPPRFRRWHRLLWAWLSWLTERQAALFGALSGRPSRFCIPLMDERQPLSVDCQSAKSQTALAEKSDQPRPFEAVSSLRLVRRASLHWPVCFRHSHTVAGRSRYPNILFRRHRLDLGRSLTSQGASEDARMHGIMILEARMLPTGH